MVGQQQRLKEGTSDGPADNGCTQTTSPGSPKTRLAMLKRSSTKAKAVSNNDPFRFQGEGVDFKGKLIGVRDVEGARGDAMCAEAMRLAKAAVKSAGQHKQRIVLNISIEGLKIKDEKSLTTLHNFPVSRISFIARDTSDARAFGFIYGCADNKYKFYGIKTAQTADRAVLSIRDMFQIVFEMKKAHLAEVKQKQEEQQNKDSVNGDGVRMDNGVAVADLLDLESELQNIEQGVNQLQNIPAFAEDSWPSADAFITPQQPNLSTGAFLGDTQQPVSMLTSSPFNGLAIGATSNNHFGTSPAVGQFGGPSQTTSDPFGDSFNPRAPPQVPVAPPSVIPAFHVTPVLPLQPTTNPWPQINTVHSAPNFQTTTFSETNPFACSAQQSSTIGADPFDTQPAQRLIQSMNKPLQHHPNSAVQWPANENSAPFAVFNENKSNFSEPRKVTSLEEAFTKLVDMDALVSGPEIKKNPFDGLINPPKIPLAAMGSHPPCIPSRASAPLVCPGANNDPFNDDFFH
uniref:PID domain-containing protein n=2 Tax=Ascaris TaxID=6251 RepID=A0A9J2Q6M7_ASCLU